MFPQIQKSEVYYCIMEKRSILSTPVDFDKSDFLSLLSLSVGNAVAVQKKIGELVIGDNGWNVDLKGGEITFGDRSFRCGILGTESNVSGTWLWGWAHTESGLPENAAAPSRRAKRNLADCEEFTTAKFGLDELHTGHNLSMAAIGAAENNVGYYRCPYSDGALFVQIEGLPEEVFAPLTIEALARQFVEVISGFYCDHRLLAAGMLYQNGYTFEEQNNGDYCIILGKGDKGAVRFEFENAGGLFRTINVNLQAE